MVCSPYSKNERTKSVARDDIISWLGGATCLYEANMLCALFLQMEGPPDAAAVAKLRQHFEDRLKRKKEMVEVVRKKD